MNAVRLSRLLRNQAISYVRITSARFYAIRTKFDDVEDKWRQTDNMSERWSLIYKAPLDKSLNYATTYVTVSSSVVALLGTYYGLTFTAEDWEQPLLLGDDVLLANTTTEALIYLVAFIGFHCAVKLLLSKFVIRLYQDGDQFVAIFRGHMYNSIKKHEFQLAEFTPMKRALVVGWGEARYFLGKKKSIILEDYFKTPAYFNYLLYKKKVTELEDDD